MPTYFRGRASLHYEIAGNEDAPLAVLLIHAFPFDSRMWRPQLEALRDYRVILPDLRGFGRSGAVTPAEDIADYAEDLITLLELEEQPAVVVGLSMGGYIAFEIARRRMDLIRALVLADTKCEPDTEEVREGRLRMAADIASQGLDPLLETMPARLLSEASMEARPDLAQRVRNVIASQPPDGVRGALFAMAGRPDARPVVPEIHVPVAVVVGEEDTITPVEVAQAIVDALPQGRLFTIPSAGHLTNIEAPEQFNAVLDELLQYVGRGPLMAGPPEEAAEEGPPVARNGGGRRSRPVAANGGGGHTADADAGPPDGEPSVEPLSPDSEQASRRGGGPGEEPSPPNTAYGLLDCPDTVIAGQEFEVMAGLGKKPTQGVIGEALRLRPEGSKGDYWVTVELLADAFDAREDEPLKRDLHVTADDPYPTFTVHLTPHAQRRRVKPTAIRAVYVVNGDAVGGAVRALAVLKDESLLEEAPKRPDPIGAVFALPSGEDTPDLTVLITRKEGGTAGNFEWRFYTPHEGAPDSPLEERRVDVGDDPERFARQVVDEMNAVEGKQPDVGLTIRGFATEIADKIPAPFWKALEHAVKACAPKRASILILSEDPYVPWELAEVRLDPLPDPDAPNFLAAQFTTGRWVFGDAYTIPPPADHNVEAMAVISGEYDLPTWQRLKEAEAEAQALAQTYGASPVEASSRLVVACIKGNPAASLLHFAIHGIYDPNSTLNGLVLIDEGVLRPRMVKGAKPLKKSPFVFLNCCQVGSGERVLGDYSGLAAAFQYAGASAVVAPLWSVKDTVARELALEFYEQVFGDERLAPAEALRRARAKFDEEQSKSSTFLAYLFYGHPALRLRRAHPEGG